MRCMCKPSKRKKAQAKKYYCQMALSDGDRLNACWGENKQQTHCETRLFNSSAFINSKLLVTFIYHIPRGLVRIR